MLSLPRSKDDEGFERVDADAKESRDDIEDDDAVDNDDDDDGNLMTVGRATSMLKELDVEQKADKRLKTKAQFRRGEEEIRDMTDFASNLVL